MDDLETTLIAFNIAFWAYFAPAAVGFIRKVPNAWSIAVINALLGWTLVGWVVALAMAVRSKPAAAAPAPTALPASTDPVEGVSRLADLHTQGLLTDEEFAAAKTRLLS